MVGNQAVTNVLLGERYKQVSKEVKNYFKGEYGIAPAPVSEELQTKILGEGGKPSTAASKTPSAPAKSSRPRRKPLAIWPEAKRTS